MNMPRLLERLEVKSPLILEVALRVVLAVTCYALEFVHPFHRTLQQGELWLYQNPHLPEKLPISLVLLICIAVPSAFIVVHYFATGDRSDLVQALLSLSLALVLTGVIGNILKVCVGRPRPDFFYRCFPEGEVTSSLVCSGEAGVVVEGRKSFPSGHSGLIFCCSGFLSLYLSGKLQIFRSPGRGQSWRLCVVIAPLLLACVSASTRIQENKHHWEDVVVGGLIGVIFSFLCYLQHYPSPLSTHCDSPFSIPYSMTRSFSKTNLKRARYALSTVEEKNSSENIV